MSKLEFSNTLAHDNIAPASVGYHEIGRKHCPLGAPYVQFCYLEALFVHTSYYYVYGAEGYESSQQN
jgi:hypothetical protein